MDRSGSARAGVLVSAMLMSAAPGAAEVVLTFGIEQRLQAGWNIDLSVPETGRTTGSVTRLSFSAITRTPIDSLEFTTSGVLEVENDADSGATTANIGRPDLGLRYTREVPNAIFSAGVQYRSDDVGTFDEDLSVADLSGRRIDTSADLRLETGRTAPLGFAISTSFRKTDYADTSDPDLIDTEIALFGVESRLRFSEVVESRIGLTYQREARADALNEVIETGTASVGLAYLLANGTAAADLTFLSNDEEGDRTTFVIGRTLVLPTAAVSARLGLTNGDVGGTDIIGSLSWTQDLPNGAVDLLVERRISFDEVAVGPVATTLFSLGFAHEINNLSSLGLSLSNEVADAPSERFELSQVSAIYRYAFTEDWGLDSGVRYRVRRDGDGQSDSVDIFVALSRSFEIRP